MLPKPQRLNLKTDFKWVASGKKLESLYLKLFFKYGENKLPRFGIALSSKTFKNAVERNRAKRLVAQALQQASSQLPPSINIVVLPKNGVVEVKSDDVLKDLEQILSNEKIINQTH